MRQKNLRLCCSSWRGRRGGRKKGKSLPREIIPASFTGNPHARGRKLLPSPPLPPSSCIGSAICLMTEEEEPPFSRQAHNMPINLTPAATTPLRRYAAVGRGLKEDQGESRGNLGIVLSDIESRFDFVILQKKYYFFWCKHTN